jgi:iron complex outermembrane receptor protein
LYQFGSTYYNFYSPLSYYNRKWEQSANSNIALDFGFLKNRITGSLEFYNRKTTDLLNNVPVAGLSNFSAFVVENVGSMTNNGVEFSLNVQPIKTKDMTWDIGFNISYNQNKITKLTNNPGAGYLGFPSDGISGTSLYAHMNAVGNAKNTFYLYKQVYSTSGKPIEGVLDDLNRDGVITPSDRYFGKVSDAPVFGGFSTNFTYRKWNAGLVIRGSYGNYVFNNVNSNMGRLNSIIGGTSIGNATQSYLTTLFTGTSAVNQTAQQGSDYYLENASFLRMDNINIGYNMGQIFNKKAYLRINLSVQNVFVITKYTGLDPEVSNGVDNNIYPRPRVTALNLNLDF